MKIVTIIFYAIISVALLILVNDKFGVVGSDPELISSDTSIIINNNYDTTIKNVIVKNYTQPVRVVVFDPSQYNLDEKIDSSISKIIYCDSVRTYKPEGGNDSVNIYNNVVVQGRLLFFDQNYKLRFPIQEKTITITNEILKSQAGLYAGFDLILQKDLGADFLNTIKPYPGINLQYITKNTTSYKLGVYTHGFNCGISKKINFKKRKTAKITP